MTTTTTPSRSAANRRLMVWLLLVVVAAMFAFGFAMVPLYNVFCELTGFNGKTSARAAAATEIPVDAGRTITVEFLANLNESAPWQFRPKVVKMQVHPGQLYHTSYFARNLTNEPLVGQAIPSVYPGQAASHFQKIECFCFARQAFAPGEGKDMPLVFRLDPAIPAHVSTVTLSYTFFRLSDPGG